VSKAKDGNRMDDDNGSGKKSYCVERTIIEREGCRMNELDL
jgi:hypothetical protein